MVESWIWNKISAVDNIIQTGLNMILVRFGSGRRMWTMNKRFNSFGYLLVPTVFNIIRMQWEAKLVHLMSYKWRAHTAISWNSCQTNQPVNIQYNNFSFHSVAVYIPVSQCVNGNSRAQHQFDNGYWRLLQFQTLKVQLKWLSFNLKRMPVSISNGLKSPQWMKTVRYSVDKHIPQW